MSDHTDLPDYSHCVGCRVCKDVCSRNAVEMIPDRHGFYFPVIDEKKCIHCRKCENTCPVVHIPSAITERKEAYVGVHRDSSVLSKSASGGAFSAVWRAWNAEAVCGVRWQEFKAVSDIGFNDEEIESFSKSKYMISDTNDIYRRAASEVQVGKKVVFSGAPCQVAAFRNYMGERDVDNLLLVDIVCHGAPSAFLFQMHLRELEAKKGKVKTWTFRDKTPINGVISSRSARVDFAQGGWEHYEIHQDAYLRMYYGRIGYRNACGSCPFAKPERVSDITVCDAHHIHELYPEMTVEKGASIILIHSDKGRRLLPEIKAAMTLLNVDYEWVVDNNEQLSKPTTIHPKTNEFYRLIDAGKSFEKAVATVTHRSFLSRVIGKVKRVLK